MKLPNIGSFAKAVAGAVGGMVAGNTGMIVMTTEQAAAMPWYGVILANVIYAGLGFLTVYIAPKNKEA